MELIYTVNRSPKRHNLSITVERDQRVVVHAPAEMADETISKVVTSKRQWIYRKINHPQKYQPLPHPPGKELVNGESLLYLGQQYRIEILNSETPEIQLTDRFFIPSSRYTDGATYLRDWYIDRAREKITSRAVYHSHNLGVVINKVKIVDNRYRWGSCTTKNNVNFNWRLIKAPMFIIDYVIVHELAHLIEANHTPDFWNIVRTQIAHVEKAKEWLKQNGQLLEQNV